MLRYHDLDSIVKVAGIFYGRREDNVSHSACSHRRVVDWGTEESADETEDLSCTRSEAKATSMRHLTSGTRDDDGESLERSSLESMLSEGTTTSGTTSTQKEIAGQCYCLCHLDIASNYLCQSLN